MNRQDVRNAVCFELAAYEHKMRSEGASLAHEVELHRDELLRYGVNLPGATAEYKAQAMAEALAHAERGELRAEVMKQVSVIVARVLRAMGGTLIPDRDCVPPTRRQPRHDEREPIKLPPIEVVTQVARDNGILQEYESGTGQSKESKNIDIQSQS